MLKKTMAVLLCLLVILSGTGSAWAAQATPSTDGVKQRAQALSGTGARVEVKLKDGSRLRGVIAEAGEETFVLREQKTGAARTIAYTEATEVKKHDMSKWVILAIVGVTVAAVAIVAAVVGDPDIDNP